MTLVCLEWPNASHVGGVGRYAYRIASALASLVNLTVVTFDGGHAIEGARMIYVRAARSRVDRFYGIPLLLRRVVGGIDSDVIHAFGDDWALKRSVPVVRTFLGSSLGEARSSTGLRKLNHYVLAATEIVSQRRAAYKIAIGPDSNSEFHCDTVMPPVVAVPMPAGVSKSPTPSVVFIGSFGGRKRGELVERSVAAVSEVLGSDVSLTVVGPSSDARNWSSGTRHLANAGDDEVAAVIAQSWVLMAPSLYEGFGIPTFEAMSLETAVIASPNPGSEYIKSLAPSATSLSLVGDSELTTVLADRLRRGAHLQDSELDQGRTAVDALLAAADPGRLVRGAYETVVGRR